MIRNVIGFLADKCGATAMEYAMIAALILVGAVGGIDMMGQGADSGMSAVSSGLETVAPASATFDCGLDCGKVDGAGR